MSFFPRPLDLINRSVGASEVAVTLDVPYGPAPRDMIDFYRPKAGSNLPVIIFFYGGSWQWGHRLDYRFLGILLARQGFLVAVPDYRLYPEVRFPEFLRDCAAATAFVLNNATAYGGNPKEVFLVGHSAGAYNAVMLALNPAFLTEQGGATRRLSGVVGLSGPYDFLPLRAADVKAIFSAAEDQASTQPITYARADAPPLFLAHGGADVTVLPRNTTALAARVRNRGGVVEHKIYPAIGHTGIMLAVLPYLSWRTPVLKDALSFIAGCRTGACAGNGSEVNVTVVS